MNEQHRGAAALTPEPDALEPFLMSYLPPSVEPMSATEDNDLGRIPMAKLHNPPADAPAAYVRELMECGVVDGDWLYIKVSDWRRLRTQHLKRPSEVPALPQPSAAAAVVAAIVAHDGGRKSP